MRWIGISFSPVPENGPLLLIVSFEFRLPREFVLHVTLMYFSVILQKPQLSFLRWAWTFRMSVRMYNSDLP